MCIYCAIDSYTNIGHLRLTSSISMTNVLKYGTHELYCYQSLPYTEHTARDRWMDAEAQPSRRYRGVRIYHNS